ncbi:hypothetical protein GGQ54_001481 [Naumannella cuiyingiana]|uniref:Uncharacterized protein n=1 Tax=Naumannella cuiyingiana TaxID=1347891 RepID=A0A7Z0D8X2_9ACTN|nr:hypothetical protein [Naumannella cuiyingiana]NYI70921.1 hypothetical protein [Naumannella cuiyingiana]
MSENEWVDGGPPGPERDPAQRDEIRHDRFVSDPSDFVILPSRDELKGREEPVEDHRDR